MPGVFAYILAATAYLAAYPSESGEALDYFRSHKIEFIANTPGLTSEQRAMAAAIVAPEVSQFSTVLDFVQLRSLYVTYIYQGSGDFSVGIFQMKPSFAERMESELTKDKSLRSKYSSWLAEIGKSDNSVASRRARLERLESDVWHMRYLTIFYKVAERNTSNMRFTNSVERLRYYATLYNSGIDCTPAKVKRMQQKKLFPRDARTHNYSEVAVEFYSSLNPLFYDVP